MFADDLEFSVPAGVDFISRDENVHFSSVLVFHRPSQTIHVDDTFLYLRFPAVLRPIGLLDALRFHPTLAQALQKRAGATDDFRRWAQGLAERWRDAENLCAAHLSSLTKKQNPGSTIHARLLKALDGVSDKLSAHAREYG